MVLGAKEKQIILVSLRHYLRELEQRIKSADIGDDERADLGNDATLVELLISRLEHGDSPDRS
jgi:hypothetical protein